MNDHIEAIALIAGRPDANGHVFESADLKKLAGGDFFWDEQRSALVYRGPMLAHIGAVKTKFQTTSVGSAYVRLNRYRAP